MEIPTITYIYGYRMEYDRAQCRAQQLSLTPMSDLPDVCIRYICPVAAMLFNRSLECECDPTGSLSGICSGKGGQCDCKPNVIGRRLNCLLNLLKAD